jgi:hypothetical protein
MKCLRSLSKSRPLGDSVCAQAAEHGHLKLLKWLRCQDPPCPINLNKCIALAAENRHIKVVDWLSIQSGCANCSRNDCKCKNRKIKIPQDFIQFKNKVLLSQREEEESSDKSESKDDNSESEVMEEEVNENYFDFLTQFHQHVSDSDSEASSDLEDYMDVFFNAHL